MTTRDTIGTFLERLGRQDAEATAELFAENIDWYVPGVDELPWTGRRSARAHIPEYFHTLWSQFVQGESMVDLEEIVVEGDNAVIFANFRHTVKSNGRILTTPVAMRLRVEDGQITKMHLYEDTNAVRDAFFD